MVKPYVIEQAELRRLAHEIDVAIRCGQLTVVTFDDMGEVKAVEAGLKRTRCRLGTNKDGAPILVLGIVEGGDDGGATDPPHVRP